MGLTFIWGNSKPRFINSYNTALILLLETDKVLAVLSELIFKCIQPVKCVRSHVKGVEIDSIYNQANNTKIIKGICNGVHISFSSL